MGNVQAIPIIGEVATVAEAAANTVAAGCCAVAGDTNGASKFIHNAGKSFENYTEVGAIGANIHLAVAAANNDHTTVERLRRNQERAWEGIADATPGVGHVKGVVHYAMGDSKKGEHDGAAVAAGVATDGVITGINSACQGEFAPTGMIAAVKKTGDSEGHADDVLECFKIPLADFVTGARK